MQLQAIEICAMLDAKEESEEFIRDLKLALVANDRENIRLFTEGREDAEQEATEDDLADPEVTLQFNDDLGQEDVEALLAQAGASFTLTGAELENEGWQ